MEQEKSRYQMDSYWRGRIFGICLLLAGITFIAEIIYCTAGYLGLIDVNIYDPLYFDANNHQF